MEDSSCLPLDLGCERNAYRPGSPSGGTIAPPFITTLRLTKSNDVLAKTALIKNPTH
jgi:hypothetical protein